MRRLLIPLYILIGWLGLTSYQTFVNQAVTTITQTLSIISPPIANWINNNLEIIKFINAFAWVFILTSLLPSILSKNSVFIQFITCLTLAVTAAEAPNLIAIVTPNTIAQLMTVTAKPLQNFILAAFYLSLPYAVLLWLDLRSKQKILEVTLPPIKTKVKRR